MNKLPVKSLTTLFFIFLTPYVSAQYQDFRSWWNFDLSKEITNDFNAGLELSQRFDENSLQYDRSLTTLGLEYEITKDLSVEGGYRFVFLQDRQFVLVSKYRIHGNVSYRYKHSSFSLSLREQIQYGFDDLNTLDYYFENKLISQT